MWWTIDGHRRFHNLTVSNPIIEEMAKKAIFPAERRCRSFGAIQELRDMIDVDFVERLIAC
jgi:hypothetical protein